MLVTGGAGFIGSRLAIALANAGHDVVAADSFASGHFANFGDVLAAGDATQILTLPVATDVRPLADAGPFDVVFHQASLTGVIRDDGSADLSPQAQKTILLNNVEQFRSLLDLCATWGSTLVWASSCSVYGRGPVPMREDATGEPLNAYALSKLAKERLASLHAGRLKHPPIALRYSNAYGPGEDHKGPLASMIHQLAKQMRQGKRPRIFEHGEQRRDFVYVDDCVAANFAAWRAAESGDLLAGKAVAVNAGAGRSWSFNEVVEALNKTLGTDLPPDYFPNPYDFTQDHTETDMSRCEELIGHVPKFDLERGIAAYAATERLGVATT